MLSWRLAALRSLEMRRFSLSRYHFHHENIYLLISCKMHHDRLHELLLDVSEVYSFHSKIKVSVMCKGRVKVLHRTQLSWADTSPTAHSSSQKLLDRLSFATPTKEERFKLAAFTCACDSKLATFTYIRTLQLSSSCIRHSGLS
jgi:hypothetical protein